jgi:hypothetical protein
MKTLREMMDLITEATQAKYPAKLDDMYGGGTLNQTSVNGTVTSTYTNKKGEVKVKLIVSPKESRIFINGDSRGEEMTKFSSEELYDRYMNMVVNDMMSNYDQINSEVNKHKDTLSYLKDLVSKMNGKNMNESQKINEDVRAAAIAHVKPFFDDLLVAIKRVRGEITEPLEENTSVNMSPYKESIQNAESTKQKAAKNKISELIKK